MTSSACQESSSGPLFSDRLWIVKVGIALGLFSMLCRRSGEEIGELIPDTQFAAAETDAFLGKTIYAWALKVLAVTPKGFDVETKAGPVHVETFLIAPKPGDYVSFAARIVAPKQVVASVARIDHGYLWKRGLNYSLSSVTVLVFLWLVRRRFRWRLSEGLFRSRY